MRALSRRAMVLFLGVSMTMTGVLLARPAAADTLVAFDSVLNGAQETPPNNSPSTGVALVLLVKETNMVCYRLSYTPLGSAETVAHFHIDAAPGVASSQLVPITPSPSPVGSPKHGCVQFNKDQVKALTKGLVYLNVHTTTFPAGEIRGQVLPTKIKYSKVTAPSSPSAAFLD
jgi:CHRD domain-containing protein